MKTLQRIVAASLVFGLASFGLSAQAQSNITSATQQGKGAYVTKTDREAGIQNALLGILSLPTDGYLPMRQTKFVITPSGNSMAVWEGTVPAEARPAQRVTYRSTYTETEAGPLQGKIYDTVAVTEPNGSIKLTLTMKQNGKGKKK
ncbi:hypothetical protein [Hymenobacter terrestris]|uniref:Lipocalin-like domain-containing protein n=1 Tax=Hymenobacter terrestris TaxID=2748310 RepID=A0ABX2Q748_9BACT|nr:hypothetical protein [Hymenobacter terrestris]NVO86800.1 hypothetical protein [Hymenobacter terrestris]